MIARSWRFESSHPHRRRKLRTSGAFRGFGLVLGRRERQQHVGRRALPCHSGIVSRVERGTARPMRTQRDALELVRRLFAASRFRPQVRSPERATATGSWRRGGPRAGPRPRPRWPPGAQCRASPRNGARARRAHPRRTARFAGAADPVRSWPSRSRPISCWRLVAGNPDSPAALLHGAALRQRGLVPSPDGRARAPAPRPVLDRYTGSTCARTWASSGRGPASPSSRPTPAAGRSRCTGSRRG